MRSLHSRTYPLCPFSLKSASRPAPLEGEHFDVIGGAIIEAGIARDATLRGLRVALFEQSDSGFSQDATRKRGGTHRFIV
jgi:glycerol-3-phosphate dehydrogenase